MIKLLLSDLDGTLIQTRSGEANAKGPWDWILTEGICDAINGYGPSHLHIVSNQGGIAQGYVKESDWIAKVGRIIEKLKAGCPGINVSYDYCKSLRKKDPKRKPNPGMLLEFLESYQDCDDEIKVLMIGDASGLPGNFSDSDYQAAKAAGIQYLDIHAFLQIYG